MAAALALALCALLGASSSRADGWKVAKRTGDGIVVYTRDTPGSPVRQVRAETVVDAAPAQVWQALMDRETYKSASKHVERSVVYKTAKASVWYTYQVFAFPMLSKRDYTLRYESFADASAGSYRLVWTIANEHGPPPRRGVVRLTRCGGHFLLRPDRDGRRTSVEYWLHLDPGGSVPAWAANLANRSSVPDLLRAVRSSALKRGAAKR